MKLAIALTVLALFQGPVVNTPTADVTTIRIPPSVSDDVIICAESKLESVCIKVGDFRRYIRQRRFAN